MKTILLNRKFYSIAEKWEELTPEQLLQVMQVLFMKNYPAEQTLLKLLHVLTGAPLRQLFRWNVEEAEEYFYLLAFLLRPDFEFTKNLLLIAPVKWKTFAPKFYGPVDHLDNLRMKEFTDTEAYFMQWFDSEKKDIFALNRLVAILYRPASEGYDKKRNLEGDLREPYNQNLSAYYTVKYVSLWPLELKLAIATWYDGCRRHIVSKNPDVFEGGSGEPSRYGLVSIMLNVAECGVFGNFEKVEEQYVHLVLMQLNEVVDQGKRLEKASKS